MNANTAKAWFIQGTNPQFHYFPSSFTLEQGDHKTYLFKLLFIYFTEMKAIIRLGKKSDLQGQELKPCQMQAVSHADVKTWYE